MKARPPHLVMASKATRRWSEFVVLLFARVPSLKVRSNGYETGQLAKQKGNLLTRVVQNWRRAL